MAVKGVFEFEKGAVTWRRGVARRWRNYTRKKSKPTEPPPPPSFLVSILLYSNKSRDVGTRAGQSHYGGASHSQLFYRVGRSLPAVVNILLNYSN